ncbi:AAEL013067-PA [Aedes aegypti]|uniref:AAEL013067-PA n=1 Tax=Aedes aegypti TaxID=7159 RepID=Q16KA5_AEDAE|nr:AAEL013067-PA [Aedes aegypti]
MRPNRLLVSFILVTLSVYAQLSEADVPPEGVPNLAKSKKDRQKSEKLPPCRACTVLVNSFRDGMKRTERSKHDGGDAAWEEERLGSYKTSELRLVEIQEGLCRDVGRGEDQCHLLAEEHEPQIEEWWKEHQTAQPDLHQWLCVEQAQVCCPDGFYGPNCDPCPSCFGNGKCKGNGTRKGNGKCAARRATVGTIATVVGRSTTRHFATRGSCSARGAIRLAPPEVAPERDRMVSELGLFY